jgi:DNA invertase Pin-like site-specific DNA recombinase
LTKENPRVHSHPFPDSHPSSIFRSPTIRDRPGGPLVRVAFIARVSTDDQQDPTLSLPRQFTNCRVALPDGWEITVLFWDIESGRMDLDRRGRGHAHEHINVPLHRDGGLADLLAEAEYPGRRFDVVVCESIDRLARRTYIGTTIEHQLEQVGVRLYAADEPIDPRGKRSTGLLIRRVKQGVAEWYVTDMLERSWDGFKVHTGQGWNIGKPPYGYAADKVDHPVPAKAADQPAPTPRHLVRVGGTRHPDKPEVHRLHGVEPPRHQIGRQGQPARGVGVVRPAHPRAAGIKGQVRGRRTGRQGTTRIPYRVRAEHRPPAHQTRLPLTVLRPLWRLRTADVRKDPPRPRLLLLLPSR